MKTEEFQDKKKLKRILIVKKYKSCFDKQLKIKHEIKDYLKTEKILEPNDKILIGTLVKKKCPRFDKDKKLIPYSYVGPNRTFVLKRRKALKNAQPFALNKFLEQNKFNLNNIKISEKKQNNNSPDLSGYISDKDPQEQYYKIIDNKYLTRMYKNIYNKIKKNHSMTNNEYKTNYKIKENKFSKTISKKIHQLPESLTRNLLKQEKILKNNINFEKLRQKINKIIKKKVHKINKDLLINIVYNNNNSVEKPEKITLNNSILKNWNFKLRNPKVNGLYQQNGYYRTNMSDEELYCVINLNKEKEIFVNSIKNNIKNNYINNIRKKQLNKDWEKVESLESLKVKGNNLLDYEFKNEMKLKGKKKLYDIIKLSKIRYRDENKEKISGYDLENNFKDYYNDKIFAYNYDINHSDSHRKLCFNSRNNFG